MVLVTPAANQWNKDDFFLNFIVRFGYYSFGIFCYEISNVDNQPEEELGDLVRRLLIPTVCEFDVIFSGPMTNCDQIQIVR